MFLLESAAKNFMMKEFPVNKQFTTWWLNFNQWDSLTDKTQKYKHRVLIEEKLEDIGARLELTPGKSQICLAQETGVSGV
jgi:hypothetical protein